MLAAAAAGAPLELPGEDLWPDLVRVADRERLLPALAAASRAVAASDLPDGLAPFLAGILASARRRNAALRRQLAEAAALLNGIGVQPVLLKGAARLHDRLYAERGARLMGDLDLLVPEDRLEAGQACMLAAGYCERLPDFAPPPGGMHHAAMLLRADWPAAVELHRCLSVPPFDRMLPPGAMAARSTPVDLDGPRARLPAPDDQLLHLVLHAQIHHGGHAKGRLALLYLLEGWLLLRAIGSGAGAALLDRLGPTGHRGLGAAWLAAIAARFADSSVAPPALGLSSRLFLVRARAQERWAWLDRVGGLGGHYAHALHRATCSPARRRRLLRGLVDRAYCRRRRGELQRLLRHR